MGATSVWFLRFAVLLLLNLAVADEYAQHKFQIHHNNLDVRVAITEKVVPQDFKIEMSVKEKLYLYSMIIQEITPGKSCNLVMTGQKIVENFENLDTFIHEEDKFLKPIFLKIHSGGAYSFQVDNFFVTHWSLESTAKFLPYEFRQLKDLYTFRYTEYPTNIPSTTFEVLSMSEGCMPTINTNDFRKLHPWYKDKDHTGGTKFKRGDEPGAAAYQSDKLYAQQPSFSYGSVPVYESTLSRSARYRRQAENNDNDTVTAVAPTELYDPNECEFNPSINRWQCKMVTANILHEDQRHMFMIATYMQLYLMAMAGAFKPKTTDFEICTVSMEPYHFYDKDITVYGPSPDSDKYTMHECCEVMVHTREAFSMADFKPGRFELTYWICHDPYLLTKRTLFMIPWLAFILTLLSPMFVVTCLPGLKTAAARKRLIKLEQNLRRRRKEALKEQRNEEGLTQGAHKEEEKPKSPSLRTRDTDRPKDLRLRIRLDDDEKPQSEVVPLKGYSNVPGDTNPGSNQWQRSELIWVDANPIYTFNFKTIFSYLLLFNIANRMVIVIRRYLFFVSLSVLLFLGLAQLQVYYTTISYRSVLWIFRIAYQNVLAVHLHSRADFTVGLLLYVLAIPAVIGAVLFILLYPIFSQARSTAEILHWEEHETRLGRYMAVHCQLTEKRHESFESKIIDNMSTRIGYLTQIHLYKYFGEKFLYPMPDSLRIDEDEDVFSSRLTKRLMLVAWYLARLPIFIVVLPTHVFPAFTMWFALLINPCRVLPSSSQVGHVYQMCRLPIIISGLVLLNVIAFYLCVVYGQMMVFLVIDFIRNMKVQMPRIIFYLSLVYNVNAAFNNFGQDYLDLKSKLFDILKEAVQPEPLDTVCVDDKSKPVVTPDSNMSPGSRRKRMSTMGLTTPDKRQSTMTEDILMGDLEKLEAKIDRLFQIAKIPPLADPEEDSQKDEPKEEEDEASDPGPPGPPPLLVVTGDGELGMPLLVFEYVCERHMPYWSKVGSMLFRLSIHLIIISFLFTVVIDFQVLDALQDIGQGLITLITVSLPSLASSAASASLAHIQEQKYLTALRQTVHTLIGDGEFWSVYEQEKREEEEATLERLRQEQEKRNRRKGRKKNRSSADE